MLESQEMYKAMFKVVIQYSADTNIICGTRPGYLAGLNRLQKVVQQIEISEGTQSVVITGTTKDRKTLYADLVLAYLFVTNGAAGYADSINNNTLYDNFNKSNTDVERFGFDSIGAKTAQLILDVNPYLTILGTDWGVDATVMSNLASALSDYNTDTTTPRQAIVTRKTETKTVLPPLYTEGRKILKRTMDKAANTIKPTEAKWFNGYEFSKKLITIHHEITTIKALVTDSITKKPIVYPKVSSPEEHIDKIGDLNGSAILQPFIPGDSTLLIEAAGYHSKTVPAFHIKPGETLHFNIELDPIVIATP